MDPLSALGLAGNVVQFVEYGVKICSLVKEYSSLEGCPRQVSEFSHRLNTTLQTVNDLNDSDRVLLENEKATLELCATKAAEFLAYLEEFRVSSVDTNNLENSKGFLVRRKLDLRKVCLAFKTKWKMEKLQELDSAIDQLLKAIMLQNQSRSEGTTLRVEANTMRLLESSKQLLGQLDELKASQTDGLVVKVDSDSQNIKTQRVFSVHASRNTGFVGREAVFRELRENLAPSQNVGIREAALCGLGGVGKSQIALEYAYRLNDSDPEMSVFWVHAANLQRFEQEYRAIAQRFELPGRDDPQIDTLQLVRDWFEHEYQQPWLIVVDNVDDNQIFQKTSTGKTGREYIPQINPHGSVLYTSRNRDICFQLVNDPISIPSMPADEALMLFDDRIRKTSTRAEQLSLAEELEFLPLAIIQAVKYMATRRKTVSQYLELFRENKSSRIALLMHKFSDARRRERGLESVATTWMVSFNHIERECPRASELLSLMSFLDRQGIPKSLVVNNAENAVDFDRAIGLLEDYSLITSDDTNTLYSIHRLVQDVTIAWLRSQSKSRIEQSAFLALDIVSTKFPKEEFENWPTCALYVPHARAISNLCLEMPPEEKEPISKRVHLLKNVASYLAEQGEYEMAMSNAELALELCHELTGTDILVAKAKVAYIFYLKGELVEAEDLYRGFLQDVEADSSNKGIDINTMMDVEANFAFALGENGKLEEAESRIRRLLEYQMIELGTNDKNTLESANVLGGILADQGKFTEAECEYRKTLRSVEETLGLHHPLTFSIMHNLGLLLQGMAKCEESLKLFQLVDKREKEIYKDDNHPRIITKWALAGNFEILGQREKAEIIYREALESSQKCMGPNHSFTIRILGNLVEMLEDQGSYLSAQTLFLEHAGIMRLESSNFVEALRLMRTMGRMLFEQEKYAEAEIWFRKELNRCEILQGTVHKDTFITLEWLVACLERLGRVQEVEKLIVEKLGPVQLESLDCVSALGIMNTMGCTLFKQEKYAEAEIWFRKEYPRRDSICGTYHQDSLESLDWLTLCLEKLGRFQEIEELIVEKLELVQLESLDCVSALNIMHRMGHMLFKQEKYAEAEIWFRKELNRCEILQGTVHKDTFISLEWLADCLEELGRVQEADHFRGIQQEREESLEVTERLKQTTLYDEEIDSDASAVEEDEPIDLRHRLYLERRKAN
ncbi:hypothetical protein G7Y89_g6691 [Cudoniella acicularis]|uniref:NB-ARC domain-containing protein n=1 Tax=Cudoniella acicularis TaxID=354080 RepID=A0A8H4RLS6_9HELO|nr:hypothetical protein G7Y89_g6691 [Cudoniella acicularis]